MKRLLIVSIAVLVGLNLAYGQIRTRKQVDAGTSAMVAFDGDRNYLGEDVQLYIGQELYVKGRPRSLREYAGMDAIADQTKRPNGQSTAHPRIADSPSCQSYSDELIGKYFTVLDVIPGAGKNEYLFMLESMDDANTVYCRYDADNEAVFPFLIVKYYETQKTKYLGKEYYLNKYFNRYYWKDPIDSNTGEPIDLKRESIWRCVDFVFDEEYYHLSLVLENTIGEQLLMGVDDVNGRYHKHWMIEKDEVDVYKELYGVGKWDAIQQLVAIQG